jgi:hypothetical protein
MNHTQRIEQYLREGRTVSGGKGDQTAKSAETSSAAFQSTLQNAFAAQFGKQSGVLNFLNNRLTSQINNPTGFTPATKEALNTNAIQTTASQFQNADKAAQEQEAAHGGSGLPSGVDAQIQGQLQGQAAGQLSSELNANTVADAEQQQKDYWSAVSSLSGVASAEDPLGYASGSNGASAGIADLSQAYNASNQSQLLGALGGIAGGVGAAAGGYLGKK